MSRPSKRQLEHRLERLEGELDADQSNTESLTVRFPTELRAGMNALVEHDRTPYENRSQLVRDAVLELTGKQDGLTIEEPDPTPTDDSLANPTTTRSAVVALLRHEGDHSRREITAKLGEEGHGVADVDSALEGLEKSGEVYQPEEDLYRITVDRTGGRV